MASAGIIPAAAILAPAAVLHRGTGMGTALLKDLLAEAERAGKPVRLQVLKTNRAIRLYARLGFAITGESPTHLQMEWRPGPPGP